MQKIATLEQQVSRVVKGAVVSAGATRQRDGHYGKNPQIYWPRKPLAPVAELPDRGTDIFPKTHIN